MSPSRWTRVVALLAALLVTAAALAGCGGKKTPAEQRAAQAYLTALGNAGSAAAAALTTDAPTARAALDRSLAGLGSGVGTGAGVTGSLQVTGLTARQASTATAGYQASWTLPGIAAHWKYSGTLPMVKQGKTWLVRWQASDFAPTVTSGNHLSVVRTQPARAALTDRTGRPLLTRTPVVVVGIDSGAVGNLPSLATTLAAVPQLQSTAGEIERAVKAAGKNQFVPIITLRTSVYAQIRSRIHDLPGTEFQTSTELLPPSSGFARPLLGSVGPATKEIVDAAKGAVRGGDQVGLSGLEQALDQQLRGTPGYALYLAGDSDGSRGARVAVLSAPVAGKPVRLTLDTATQQAADTVLAGESLPAAIVVTQPSTGRILAAANSPSAPGDIALTGQYPAGSTFKIVTYAAEFAEHPDRTQNTAAACPATVTVDGRTFENENRFSHGTIPYSTAFGYSCNTTAIAVADGLPDGTFAKSAAQLGLGARWQLPLDAFSGSLPATATGTEKAAEAIGQGKVLVSPLAMAGLVGAAATGRSVAPSLVVGQQATPHSALTAAQTAKLNALMAATVELPGATAYTALHSLPGDIRGKTGTAEFGTDNPPKSHSWFVGVRGDLAISVFIYGGEQSTTGAVVLARDFFTALPPS